LAFPWPFLFDATDVQNSLFSYPVEEVWGIGKRLSEGLRGYGIATIGELIKCKDDFLQKRFSVTLVRTVWELRGTPCFQEEDDTQLSKSIICSRSFGKKVHTLIELREAIATYTAKAAVRLRAQEGCAGRIQVFVCKDHLHSQSVSFQLPTATAYTPELIHYAHQLLPHLFKENSSYKKAGVVLSEIIPHTEIQPDLFNPIDLEKREKVMQTLDHINRKFSRKTLTFAAEGLEQAWQVRSAHRSPRYTTSWNELPIVS
jgi:DNA polymerase V